MKPLGNVLTVLFSVIVLTACGSGSSTSSDTANNSPLDNTIDPVTDTGTPNRAPVISGTPSVLVDEGDAYAFTPTAHDADGDRLTFSVENLPSWAVFDTSTGRVSGTPGSDAAGTYSNLVIHVSDGALSATLPAYDIVVNDVPTAPVGEITPDQEEMAPALLSAVVNGSDILLSWSQDGLAPNGGYDVFIDGVDTNDQYRTTGLAATIPGLDLTVSHCFNVEARYTSSSAFYPSNQVCSQAQAADNQAPTIAGLPEASVVAGAAYSFTPSASDPEDDNLTFSVTNLPSWASFDTQTGAISGQPEESDVGVYADVTVSVSDGELTASISPFAIEVTTGQVVSATGSLSLKWIAPSTRSDGSVLDVHEIDGYRIYLGETSSSLQMEVDLNDGLADAYTLQNLPVGTYFVALTAYDTVGNASNFSNTVEVTVTN